MLFNSRRSRIKKAAVLCVKFPGRLLLNNALTLLFYEFLFEEIKVKFGIKNMF